MKQLRIVTGPTSEDLEKSVSSKFKPTVIGLFAGCGGMDYGFKLAGFNIVYANDFEKNVKQTYEKNVGPIHIEDICSVDKKQLPDCDVLVAGIPCQPFSNAGNRLSTEDERGNLFTQVMEVLKLKKPKVVVFENVKGFLSAKDGDGRLMPDRIRLELKKRGYETFFELLNASDYGVPQNRQRVIILGIRNDIKTNYEFPPPLHKSKNQTVGSVLKKPMPKNEPQEVWELSPQSQDIIKFIPEGGSWKNVPYEFLPLRMKKIRDDMKKYKSPNFYRRFAKNEIMGTITAAGTPENSGILHPTEPRRYSVREIARFQSFPDSFKFVGVPVSAKYKMIGNAVPVKLAYWIALSIKYHIFT